MKKAPDRPAPQVIQVGRRNDYLQLARELIAAVTPDSE